VCCGRATGPHRHAFAWCRLVRSCASSTTAHSCGANLCATVAMLVMWPRPRKPIGWHVGGWSSESSRGSSSGSHARGAAQKHVHGALRMGKVKIKIDGWRCLRCGTEWVSRAAAEPGEPGCPKCEGGFREKRNPVLGPNVAGLKSKKKRRFDQKVRSRSNVP
jgi:hypothetical protein